MTNYPRSAYGSNPNAGRPANGDRGAWGGYAWPGGVPSSLLGTAQGRALNGQALSVVVRKELVQLWGLLFQIAVKHQYQIWASKDGENWGPWGYENRAVSGTSYASGHSMALSVDMNAPLNPYSYTFTSDMPPAMVADFEACGLYWGGRYEGQKYDAMHFGYCYPPGSVAGHVSKAKAILGDGGGEDDDMPLSSDDIKKIGDEVIKRLKTDKVVTYAYVDNAGKESSKTVAVVDGIGSAASSAGRANWNAKNDNQK